MSKVSDRFGKVTREYDEDSREGDPVHEAADAVDEERSGDVHDVHEDSEGAAEIRFDALGDVEGRDEGERSASQACSFVDGQKRRP